MGQRPLANEPGRDRKFRHELFPKGARLVSLADALVADLLAHEAREGARLRCRSRSAARGMVNAVRVIVANLARAALFPPGGGGGLILPLGHPKGKLCGSVPDGFGKGLPGIVGGLSAIGVLVFERPAFARHASTIAPSEAFHRQVLEAGISGADIGRRTAIDRLRLSRKHRGGTRTPFPIPDTAEARLMRQQVDTINAGLEAANVAYVGNSPVDVGDRFMVRHFSQPIGVEAPCLDYGGRLCGGFWQTMPKEQRRNIRLDGEPIAEIDFGQVFPRLAYGLAGATPPDGDLYLLPELVEEEEGGPYREGVKRGANALLWGTKRWSDEIAALLPRTWPASRLRKVLAAHHPALADYLQPERITGYRLSRMESDIIVAVMLACIGQGIVALPIHDAVLVPASMASAAAAIMVGEAHAVAGVFLPVTFKT